MEIKNEIKNSVIFEICKKYLRLKILTIIWYRRSVTLTKVSISSLLLLALKFFLNWLLFLLLGDFRFFKFCFNQGWLLFMFYFNFLGNELYITGLDKLSCCWRGICPLYRLLFRILINLVFVLLVFHCLLCFWSFLCLPLIIISANFLASF